MVFIGAVLRLFEKLKRAWKEEQPGMSEKVEADGKKRRIAARRRRVNAILSKGQLHGLTLTQMYVSLSLIAVYTTQQTD